MKNTTIKIGIVDDHALFRDGLAGLLEEFSEAEVIFTAKNGIEMQQLIAIDNLPDIILLDINMPGMNGFEAANWITKNHPSIQILALSMYEDELNIIKMLEEGAEGYILKECKASELMHAIASIVNTGIYLNELVSGKLFSAIQKRKSADIKSKGITAREREFLILCCSELTYKEIASQLNLSPKTIDGYRETLFEKLNIKSRTGLVLYAIKNNIYVV